MAWVQRSEGARQMPTTVSIGPECIPLLRENASGPADPDQSLRVCHGPGPVLGTQEPGSPCLAWIAHNLVSHDVGRRMKAKAGEPRELNVHREGAGVG